MRKTIPFSTSNYNGCGLASKTCQISARHLGLRDLVLQVEDLRFYFAGATTQRLKTSYTPWFAAVLPRSSTVCFRGFTAVVRDSTAAAVTAHLPCLYGTIFSPISLGLFPLLLDCTRFHGITPASTGILPSSTVILPLLRDAST